MRALQQGRARLGQFEAAASPDKELHAELILQLAHLPAERRLSDAQLDRGLRKTLQLGYLLEISQFPHVHAPFPSRFACSFNAGPAWSTFALCLGPMV